MSTTRKMKLYVDKGSITDKPGRRKFMLGGYGGYIYRLYPWATQSIPDFVDSIDTRLTTKLREALIKKIENYYAKGGDGYYAIRVTYYYTD